MPGDAVNIHQTQKKPSYPIIDERCFIRLLGDMRSYNFVVIITPDFEDAQIRIRAMDFDQQSYNGRKNYYLPQFFKENTPLASEEEFA